LLTFPRLVTPPEFFVPPAPPTIVTGGGGEFTWHLSIIDAGLPTPQPQLWVRVPELGRLRLDLAYRGRKVAVEYDGDEHHSEDDDVAADDVRREALRRLGWYFIVVRHEDFAPERLDDWLRELRDVVAQRAPSRPHRYARAERSLPRR